MSRPHIVIIGGGFAGLECARVLGRHRIPATLIDRRNHNLFQPLLYQVATAALSPADVAEPIRKTLTGYDQIAVVLAEAERIDAAARKVFTRDGLEFEYDYLVLATGSSYNYFGHPEWEAFAPGLKTLSQARTIRQQLLKSLEHAEVTTDPLERRRLLTSVIVGGGPTGVEMAGAIAELFVSAARDYQHLEPEDFRVVLVEAGDRLLASFPEQLGSYAREELERLGVEVRLGASVDGISETEVVLKDGEVIPSRSVVWGAGVKAAPMLPGLDAAEAGAAGRIKVDPTLRVTGYENIFALGDVAAALDDDGKPLPALAQVAKQQGQYLGKMLVSAVRGTGSTKPFRFRNRGNTAVIGRHAAVFDFGRWHLKGRLAWFLWALVHVYLLVSFEKRILVSIQWLTRYLTKNRSARVIDEGR